MKKSLFTLLAGAAALATGFHPATARADAFTFGVMADTQQTVTGGTNSVATGIISEVNKQFNAAGVDFVVQVGDLTDTGSLAGLQSRLDANAGKISGVTGLNSPFYALRGNHEDSGYSSGVAGDTGFFQTNYIPTSSTGVNVQVAPDNLSYAVTYKNTKIVMLDINTSYYTSTLDSVTNWMSNTGNTGVLQGTDHTQAFVFEHKNLLGQNHKDNEFGSGNDSNPTQQNAFFAALAGNNVKYDISGHDHMDHRSIVTSPDGQNKVQEIISQSDSTKFYTSSTGFSTREQSVSDQQNMIGYYTYTVDGPRVTGKYYATPVVNNTVGTNPTWTLQDTFGYSLNGKQVTVARGTSTLSNDAANGSYKGITDNTDKAKSMASTYGENGYVGTLMTILDGSNSTTATAEGSRACADDLNTGWAPKTAGTKSDILSLWGMNNALGSGQTDTFVLSLHVDPATLLLDPSKDYLGYLNSNGVWVNAVDGNFGAQTPTFVDGAYVTGMALGTYGINTADNTAWAVINHNSDFAAVPEPGTNALIALAVAALAGLHLRNRRKANA